MSLDPFTFVAQMVNFAILLWILKKVLYGPVLAAIAAREQAYLARQAHLDELEKVCQDQTAALDQERLTLQRQREEMTREGLREASEIKEGELSRNRREVALLRQRWEQAVEEQKDAFLTRLRERTGRTVLTVVRRVLTDLSGSQELQKLAVDRFLSRYPERDPEASVLVRSAAEIDSTQRAALESRFSQVAYELDPGLVLGLELVKDGQRVGWSIPQYLEGLNAEFETSLREAALS